MNHIDFAILRNEQQLGIHPGILELDTHSGKNYISFRFEADILPGDVLKYHNNKTNLYVLSVAPAYDPFGKPVRLKVFFEPLVERNLRQAEEDKKLKQQFRHNWRITIFNVFGGAIAGLITSIIFWLLTD